MRILIATQCRNPVIRELVAGLERMPQVAEVVVGQERFWSAAPGEFDVVHIHWPEALFRWRIPSPAEVTELSERLSWWRAHCAVVTTVHNLCPHDPKRRAAFESAYRAVFSGSDGLIHMGEASQPALTAEYPAVASLPQLIAPHPLYTVFGHGLSQREARGVLNIGTDEQVTLCFGSLRLMQEARLLVRAFRRSRASTGRLLVVGKLSLALSRAARLAIKGLLYLGKNIQPHLKFVPDDEVQLYLQAADVVVVPRIETLNSGNVVLGFSYGRVVVGPDTGVAGELLRAAGNPVYEPGNANSFARAIDEAFELSRGDTGWKNLRLAQTEWNSERVAAMHVDFFHEILARSGKVSSVCPGTC